MSFGLLFRYAPQLGRLPTLGVLPDAASSLPCSESLEKGFKEVHLSQWTTLLEELCFCHESTYHLD